MFLLESHPEPIALSNAVKLKPRPNPQPQRFVAAYDTVSASLNVPKNDFWEETVFRKSGRMIRSNII